MSYVVLTPPTLEQEPVSLELLKAHLRVAGTTEDALLTLNLQAARSMAERFCGRFFAACEVAQTFAVSDDYQLDPLAGEPTAVEGLGLTLADLPPSWEEYRKGISISRDYPLGYRPAPTYTVTYPVEATPERVPADVKAAILKLAGDLYEHRENSITGTIHGPLELSAQRLLLPYVVKPLVY